MKKEFQKIAKKRRPLPRQRFTEKHRIETLERVRQLAAPICQGEGIELVHIEYQREPVGRVLRLYLDKPEGITLDDCAAVSRMLGDLLDVHLEGGEKYHLEVSSPGTERPLVKEADFVRFKGHCTKIRTTQILNDRKNFKGIIQDAADGMITLSVNDKTVVIPFREIDKARLVDGEKPCS